MLMTSRAVSCSSMQSTLPHRAGDPALIVYSPGSHSTFWQPLEMTGGGGAGWSLLGSLHTAQHKRGATAPSGRAACVFFYQRFAQCSSPKTHPQHNTHSTTPSTAHTLKPQHCPWRAAAADVMMFSASSTASVLSKVVFTIIIILSNHYFRIYDFYLPPSSVRRLFTSQHLSLPSYYNFI